MISYRQRKRVSKYCSEPIENIKGYNDALNSPGMFDCHHINEKTFTMSELKMMNMYYNRPASELIFLSHADHARLHQNHDMVTARFGEKHQFYGKPGRQREESPSWKGDEATGSAKYKRGKKLFKLGLISSEELEIYRKLKQEYRRSRRNKDG